MPNAHKPEGPTAPSSEATYLLGYTIEFKDGWWRVSKYAGKADIPQELSGIYPDLESCQRSIFKYNNELR